MNLPDLCRLTQLGDADAHDFHRLRKQALEVAAATYEDRAASYNVSHEPYREMPFGVVSLVSELQKRVIRLTSLVNPMREEELRKEDIERITDTFIDTINYASWGYAMMEVALTVTSEDRKGRHEQPAGETVVGTGTVHLNPSAKKRAGAAREDGSDSPGVPV